MSATPEYAPIRSGEYFAPCDEMQVDGGDWKLIPSSIIAMKYVTEIPMRHGVDFRRPLAARSPKESTP